MSDKVSRPWPPPPDLSSIQELVRNADPLHHLADGAPADEYDPEEEKLFSVIHAWPTAELLSTNLLPVIERVWTESCALSSEEVAEIRPQLLSLAKEIERFFGPESQPRTRAQILADTEQDTPVG